MSLPEVPQAKEPNKLIVCFDGTGNTFSGSNADTNVVKILNKLDRQHPHQYHYYQSKDIPFIDTDARRLEAVAGVGTYDINETSVHKSWIGEMRSSLSKTVDQAIGTTFDAHIMAGYRFIMRHYETGDKIYMFGFSRGAFTARFLARMIHTVGLLCKGNEELVPFAYLLYQRYLAGEMDVGGHTAPTGGDTELLIPEVTAQEYGGDLYESARNETSAFSNTLCRKERIECDGKIIESDVKVYFLGMWDCVNSVAVFERTTPLPVLVKGTADFVRHAVSVDERRVKFKLALIAQDTLHPNESEESIKEVWFPGCHGDVGGGWPATDNDNLEHEEPPTLWHRFKDFWFTNKPKEATKDVRKDAFQMSDVALSWMIRELELVGELDPKSSIRWSKNAAGYKRAFVTAKSQKQALKGFIHDSLRFGRGAGFFTVLMWKLMEYLPIISRWELVGNKWIKVRFPLNKGSYRDIPRDALLHESLVYRLRNVDWYSPGNNHGGSLEPCLKHKDVVADFKLLADSSDHDDQGHRVYVFPNSNETLNGF
ncbi:hypothetical protein HJFPF1_13545 [Paramyrothecium foliicola]|nr:hypothetical protein HJFPF1_13545 [Paramyrothecium foliicola]